MVISVSLMQQLACNWNKCIDNKYKKKRYNNQRHTSAQIATKIFTSHFKCISLNSKPIILYVYTGRCRILSDIVTAYYKINCSHHDHSYLKFKLLKHKNGKKEVLPRSCVTSWSMQLFSTCFRIRFNCDWAWKYDVFNVKSH